MTKLEAPLRVGNVPPVAPKAHLAVEGTKKLPAQPGSSRECNKTPGRDELHDLTNHQKLSMYNNLPLIRNLSCELQVLEQQIKRAQETTKLQSRPMLQTSVNSASDLKMSLQWNEMLGGISKNVEKVKEILDKDASLLHAQASQHLAEVSKQFSQNSNHVLGQEAASTREDHADPIDRRGDRDLATRRVEGAEKIDVSAQRAGVDESFRQPTGNLIGRSIHEPGSVAVLKTVSDASRQAKRQCLPGHVQHPIQVKLEATSYIAMTKGEADGIENPFRYQSAKLKGTWDDVED